LADKRANRGFEFPEIVPSSASGKVGTATRYFNACEAL
jgi:hypothetical protein